jgi:hypothetical protein
MSTTDPRGLGWHHRGREHRLDPAPLRVEGEDGCACRECEYCVPATDVEHVVLDVVQQVENELASVGRGSFERA